MPKSSLHYEMSIPNDSMFLHRVRDALKKFLSVDVLPQEQVHMIILAVDEAVANVIEHAFEDAQCDHQENIKLVLDLSSTRLEIRVTDHGRPFDPGSVPGEVNLRESVRLGKKGGLGIFLIRKIMDEVHYDFKRGKHNQLIMIKYVDNPDSKAKSDHSSRAEGAPNKCH